MPIVMSTVSGSFVRPDLGSGSITVYIEAATVLGLLTYSGSVIAGKYPVKINSDGTASVTLPQLPQAGISPSDARWRLVMAVGSNVYKKEFNLTGDTTWASLVDVSSTPITSSILAAALAAVASVKIGTWQATTAYVSAQAVQAPDGSIIKATASRTSRASFDATEQTFWTPVSTTTGTLEKIALDATYTTKVPPTGQHPLTGMWHADAYGDKTLKTSNVNLAIADAVAAGPGACVFMREGAWTCDEAINMSSSQVLKLLGAGHTLTRVAISSTSSFGFLELIGSVAPHVEGIGFTMSAGSFTAQYGILGGRAASDASVPYLKLKDVYVFGRFTLAACFVLNAEQAHYEDCIFWADQGAGLVLARDQRNFSAITAKWTAISTTSGYGGGDGLIRLDRVQCTTTRTLAAGPTDYPLVVEFAQTFVADSLYTLSAGPHLVVLDKRIDQATFRGLHQEFGGTGATEPYGIYMKNTLTGSENRTARVSIEGSSIYSIFGEDNVKVTGFCMKSSGFRSSTKSFNFDVWSAENVEVPIAGTNYTATSANEQTTPTYNRRDGSVLVTSAPMQILKASTALDFPSTAGNGGTNGLTVSVPGARVGDPCSVNVNPAGLTAGIILNAGVSATDTVTVRATNVTTAAIDPAAVTVFVTVYKFS